MNVVWTLVLQYIPTTQRLAYFHERGEKLLPREESTPAFGKVSEKISFFVISVEQTLP